MEDEVVRRRRRLSRYEFLDLPGPTNLIPGPNSTEMAIRIGRKLAGCPGLLIAGGCFILLVAHAPRTAPAVNQAESQRPRAHVL